MVPAKSNSCGDTPICSKQQVCAHTSHTHDTCVGSMFSKYMSKYVSTKLQYMCMWFISFHFGSSTEPPVILPSLQPFITGIWEVHRPLAHGHSNRGPQSIKFASFGSVWWDWGPFGSNSRPVQVGISWLGFYLLLVLLRGKWWPFSFPTSPPFL